jgi:hypothetical protein
VGFSWCGCQGLKKAYISPHAKEPGPLPIITSSKVDPEKLADPMRITFRFIFSKGKKPPLQQTGEY